MYTWVVVTPQASAVTDEAGRFTLIGVPAGNHRLTVWHETLGVLEVPILVKKEEQVLEPILFARSGNSS